MIKEKEFLNFPWIFRNENGEVKIAPQRLYEHLKQTSNILTTDKGNVFIYDESNGLWKLYSPSQVKAFIKSYMPVEYRHHKQVERVYIEFITDFPEVHESDFNNDENIINLDNGILNLGTGIMEEHSTKYKSTIQIPAQYKESYTMADAPVFDKFLNDICEEDSIKRKFLLQFIGAVISNVKGWRFKKMLLMVGKGNTGKSILRELCMHLVGLQNCVSIELKKLNERFGTSSLYGKRFSGSGDLEYVELSEVNTIKSITGGDELFAEYKGKDSFTFRYDGFIWCNCNRLPYFRGDRGEWVYDRFIIVRCDNVIPVEKRDPQLLDKLLTEKDAIVSIAIKEFMAMMSNKDKKYRFAESEDMKLQRERYKIENNSLLTFINECCILRQDYTKRSEFNKAYVDWCNVNYVKPERQRDIGMQLMEAFGLTPVKRNGHYYYNLAIRDEDSEAAVEHFLSIASNMNLADEQEKEIEDYLKNV